MSGLAPTPDFTVDVDTTCLGNVTFTDLSTNGPTSWSWNFGDGNTSTLQNPSHTYLANGLYTVELIATNAIGSNNVIKTNYIFVNAPTAPTVSNDTICTNNTSTLSALGTGILNWYNVATGGTILNTGGTYTTPPITATTNYYVEDVIVAPNQNLGKPDTTGSGANFNNLQYLIFDVYQSMEIVSVVVYSGAAANRTIELRSSTGTVLQTKTVNIPNGTNTVPLNFSVAPGTNYQLGVSSTSNIDMFRNDGSVNYPYTINGLASITRSSASVNGGLNHYYFFYDWVVKEPDCVSPRTMVTVTVNTLPTVLAVSSNDSVCAGNSVTLTGNGAISYSWNNSVTDGVSFVPTASMDYIVTGIGGNGCSNTDTITVTVNPLPNVLASNDTIICSGDVVNLSASGANVYTWDNGLGAGQSQTPSPTVNTTYTVTGTDVNNCINTDIVNVTVNICTGIEENGLNPQVISYFNSPNNTLELRLINLKQGNYNLVVLNTLGQVVISRQVTVSLSKQKESFRMKSEAKGVYFVNLYTTNSRYTAKFIKLLPTISW